MSDFVAKNRATGGGVNALAVNDENRSRDRPASVCAKGSHGSLRLLGCRSVKIEGVEHRQKTARELAEPLTETHPRPLRGVFIAPQLEGGRKLVRRARARCGGRASMRRRRNAGGARRQRPSSARVIFRSG